MRDSTEHAANHNGVTAAPDDGGSIKTAEYSREFGRRTRPQRRLPADRVDLEGQLVASEAMMPDEDES
jgi:hypothetical protein